MFDAADKRSSTGNLFFTDQFDNHPWEAPPDLQPPASKAPAWPPRWAGIGGERVTWPRCSSLIGQEAEPVHGLQPGEGGGPGGGQGGQGPRHHAAGHGRSVLIGILLKEFGGKGEYKDTFLDFWIKPILKPKTQNLNPSPSHRHFVIITSLFIVLLNSI